MFRPIQFGYEHHWFVIGLAALLTGLSVMVLPQLRVDLSSKTLYNPNSEEAEVYASVLEEFGSDQIAILIARDDLLFTPAKLKELKNINDLLEDKDYIQKVDSLFTLPDIRNRDGFLELSPILAKIPEDPASATIARIQAIENPLLNGNIISDDGTLTALTIYLEPERYNALGTKQVFEDLENLIQKEAEHFDALYQLGKPATNKWLLDSLSFDQRVTLPAAGAILLILLVFSLRSLSFGLVPILNAIIASMWTAAFAALLDIPLNLLNYIVPLLLLVVGATEDVHIIHEFKRSFKETGKGKSAITLVNYKMSLALALTAGTTMLGFAATGASDLPILQQFGITAFAGIAFRFLVSLCILPATLRLLQSRTEKLCDGALINEGTTNRLSRIIIEKGAPHIRSITFAMIIATIGAAYFASDIKSSNDQSSFLGKENNLKKLNDETARALAGSTVFYVRIEDNPNAFLYSERLKQLKAITEHIRSIEGVDSARSFADPVARINHQLNEGDDAFNDIPTKNNAVKQMLLFTRPGTFDAYVNADYSDTNIIVRTSLEDSDALNKLVGSIRETLDGNHFGVLNYDITGDSVLVAAAVTSIVQAQIFSLGGMTLIVFCVISALFLSMRCGAISVVTNLFSVALVFGLMGLTGIPLNVGTCMVAAITLGIAIDDTIHILIKFNRHLRQSNDETAAIIQALRHEINPVITTSLALAGGFAVLAFSSFEPVRQFGLLSSCVILFALISDLILIPIFFSKTRLVTLWDIIGMKIRESLLSQSPFFKGISPWQAKKLILASNIEDYGPGEKVISEGTTGSTMYVVLDGELEATLDRGDSTVELAQFKFGDVFGEVGIVGASRSADVTTKTQTKMLALTAESLENLRRFSPYLSSRVFLNISKILADRLAKGNKNANSPF